MKVDYDFTMKRRIKNDNLRQKDLSQDVSSKKEYEIYVQTLVDMKPFKPC